MAYNMKRGPKPRYVDLGSSCPKCADGSACDCTPLNSGELVDLTGRPTKFDNDESFATQGLKKPVGPVATKNEVKKDDGVTLSPGFEDPVKIQKVQRKGLVPGSQKFGDKAFLKSQNEETVKRSDFGEGGKNQKLFDSNQAKISNKKRADAERALEAKEDAEGR